MHTIKPVRDPKYKLSDHSIVFAFVEVSDSQVSFKTNISKTVMEHSKFSEAFKLENTNETAENILKNVLNAIQKCERKVAKNMLNGDKLPPWIHGEHLEVLNEEKWSDELFENNDFCKELKREYFQKMFNSDDEEKAWQGLYELTKDHEIANNTLNKRAKKILIPNRKIKYCDKKASNKSINLLPTNETEVKQAIDSLYLDNTLVLKNLKSQLVPIFVMVINKIFKSGVYPRADVNQNDSTLMFNNIIEKVLCCRLMAFLGLKTFKRENEDINMNLHIDHMNREINKKNKVITIFIDLRPTFNSIAHENLLAILFKNGINGKAYELIESYLSYQSDDRNIGCCLGSTLESFFNRVIIKELKTFETNRKIIIFGDYLLLSKSFGKHDDITDSMKAELSEIRTFFDTRGLPLECPVFMPFHSHSQTPWYNPVTPDEISIDGMKVKKVNEIDCSGLHIDTSLTFATHLKQLTEKINLVLKNLRKLSELTKDELIMIYNSLIFHNLSRFVVSWGSSEHKTIKLIEDLHISALQLVNNLKEETKRSPKKTTTVEKNIFIKNNWLPIRGICLLNTAVLMFLIDNKIVNSEINISEPLRKSKIKNNHGRRSLENFGIKCYKKLPRDVKNSESVDKFKESCKRVMIQDEPYCSLMFKKKNFLKNNFFDPN